MTGVQTCALPICLKKVPIYRDDCFNTLSKNGTIEICNKVLDRHKTEYIYDWIPFKSVSELPEGMVVIGIFTDVYVNDKVEWIPNNWFGERITQWATWTSSLETNLQFYYKLDGTTGNVVDSTGNFNGINHNASRGIDGKIGTAFKFNGSDTSPSYIDTSYSSVLGDWAISMWVNASGYENKNLIGFRTLLGNDMISLVLNNPCGQIELDEKRNGNINTLISTQGIALGQFNHIVVSSTKGGDISLWINGTRVENATTSNFDIDMNSLNLYVAGRNKYDTLADGIFNGTIDEVAFWERNLSNAEVTQLWNNGDGINGPIIYQKLVVAVEDQAAGSLEWINPQAVFLSPLLELLSDGNLDVPQPSEEHKHQQLNEYCKEDDPVGKPAGIGKSSLLWHLTFS